MATNAATTTPIAIPYPDAEGLHLRFGIGACRFAIAPGAGEGWLAGSYQDPSQALPLHIERQGGAVAITQGQQIEQFPRLLGNPARFDLRIGTARPCAFSLETGASEVRCELGGVPLVALALRQGAGKAALDFAAPNPAPLELLEIGAGAAAVELYGLANANAREIRVGGGAAAFLLDFGGALARDTVVHFNGGMADITIRVPATTAARIVTEAVLGSVEVGDGFTRQGGAFCTPAALAGHSPCLAIHANAALGAIHLRIGEG